MRTWHEVKRLLLPAILVYPSLLPAITCESLRTVKLPDTTIVLAEQVAAGAFAPPRAFPTAGPRGALPVVAVANLPEFCRVAGVIRPSSDSEIKFEVWMPTSNWNGMFVGIGNGGFSGSIYYHVMSGPLSRHYATASTDTGHEGASLDASFALGHPEKLIDHAYRAVHEMTVKAKLIIAAYYGQAPRSSYWNGCSAGGRQGLVEAQRFTCIDELFGRCLAKCALKMLDWDGRSYDCGGRKTGPISAESRRRAMRTENTVFPPESDEQFVRDAFDELFDGLERLEHFVRINLIRFEDIDNRSHTT